MYIALHNNINKYKTNLYSFVDLNDSQKSIVMYTHGCNQLYTICNCFASGVTGLSMDCSWTVHGLLCISLHKNINNFKSSRYSSACRTLTFHSHVHTCNYIHIICFNRVGNRMLGWHSYLHNHVHTFNHIHTKCSCLRLGLANLLAENLLQNTVL